MFVNNGVVVRRHGLQDFSDESSNQPQNSNFYFRLIDTQHTLGPNLDVNAWCFCTVIRQTCAKCFCTEYSIWCVGTCDLIAFILLHSKSERTKAGVSRSEFVYFFRLLYHHPLLGRMYFLRLNITANDIKHCIRLHGVHKKTAVVIYYTYNNNIVFCLYGMYMYAVFPSETPTPIYILCIYLVVSTTWSALIALKFCFFHHNFIR